jgi:hypothetical protein
LKNMAEIFILAVAKIFILGEEQQENLTLI